MKIQAAMLRGNGRAKRYDSSARGLAGIRRRGEYLERDRETCRAELRRLLGTATWPEPVDLLGVIAQARKEYRRNRR